MLFTEKSVLAAEPFEFVEEATMNAALGSVENQDSPWRLGMIQAFDG